MVYKCLCGTLSRELMPSRTCSSACEIEKSQITITLHRPCGECCKAQADIFAEPQRVSAECSTNSSDVKLLPGIREPGSCEGLPPSYEQATEEPPTYTRAIAEEEPATYDNVIMAIATFQPDEIVKVWHTFRTSQLSLLLPLMTEIETLERRVGRAKRRLHGPEDIGFCEEVIIRLAREQNVLNKSLEQGHRYLDATLVFKYGLDKFQALAKGSTKLGNYDQARLHVKATSEHADRLLEMKIQLSRPEWQPRRLAGHSRQQLFLLEKVFQALEARTTSRAWAMLQVAAHCDYHLHC